MTDLTLETLEWLYRELKKTKIAQTHAEERYGVRDEELINLAKKIIMLEWLIEVVLKTREED